MDLPRKLWIQWPDPEEGEPKDLGEVTWSVDKITEHDVAFVTEESAVLAQARNHQQGYREGFAAAGEAIAKELMKL